jgi:tRNA (Thr-GGU) A37 N-methylase
MNDANAASMEKIIQVIALDDFKVQVLTSGGTSGVFDVKPYLKATAFKPLLAEARFKQVRAINYGISWLEDIDLSSDTVIYDIKNCIAGSHLLKN